MSVRLFVGNLSYDVSESDLTDFFSPVGPPSTVIIPTDRDTGKPRGFAFVEFSEQTQAEEVINRFNNQPLKGRNVTINEARERESNPHAGSGSRPYGNTYRSGSAAMPSPGGKNFEENSMGNARETRAGRKNRNFGPDFKPARKKKQRYGSRREPGGRRGPIRERSGGQFFGSVDDEDYEDDSEYKRRW